MPLVKMDYLLKQAKLNKKGIGAFSVGNMEMIIGAIQAAEELSTPIILQIAEVRLKHSPLELIGPMMVSAAKNSKIDIAVHLDHGINKKTIHRALDLGFTSVMFDGSMYSLNDNIEKTLNIVNLAKKYDATVEAELGVVGGSEDGSENHKIICTKQEDVKIFCEKTGVDALAVAIGNAHGNYPTSPMLEFDTLKKISEVTNVPLVLHGGSGISDESFRKAISLGIVKINIATSSFNSLTSKAKEYFSDNTKHNYFDLNLSMVEGTYLNVKKHINIFNM